MITKEELRLLRPSHYCCRVVLASLLICSSLSLTAAELEVDITGVKDALRDNVEAYLGIVKLSKDEDKDIPETDVRRLHARAADEIAQALQAYGYYQARVESSLTNTDKVWTASYDIDKGPVTRLRDVTIRIVGEGREQPQIRNVLAEANVATGQPLRHERYSRIKDNLLDAAYELGYLDGKYRRSRISVYPEQQLADIELELDTGRRFFFGDISIEQNILRPEFVNKYVEVSTDDPFETQRLLDLQLALGESDYFQQVEIDVEKDDARDQHIPVRVTTTANKRQKYEASVGYGTDTGPRMGLGTIFRRINRRGHQLRADLRLSAVHSTLASQYKIPVGDVASEFLDVTANFDQKTINDVDATNYAFGSSLNENRWGGRTRLAVTFEHESWKFGDDPRRSANLLVPHIDYTRKIADDLLFTRRGYSLGLSLLGAAEGVAADASFVQAHLNLRSVIPLGAAGRLLLRGEYGATETDSFDQLPPSKRFFAGGAQSVRGYGFEELSPRDAARNLIGGQYLAAASVELDYLFYKNFGVAVFADAGNASADPGMSLRKGAGLGFRYRSPIGMIRVDFAHPFDDPDRAFRLHVSVGPDLQ